MGIGVIVALTMLAWVTEPLYTAVYMALFLLVAVKLVLKIKIRYFAAYKVALVGVILFYLPGFVRTIPYYAARIRHENPSFLLHDQPSELMSFIILALTTSTGFLLCTAAYGRLIKLPETQAPIGFLDGMKVAVVQFLILYIASMIFLDVRYFLPEGPHLWL